MKRHIAALVTALLLFGATQLIAGEGHGKYKCSASAETCVNKMASKLSSFSYDGIWVKGIASGEQVEVIRVDEESAGAKAGIQVGDVLAKMDGKPLADLNPEQFNELMKSVKIGDQVTYAVNRDGQWKKVQVTMTEMPKKAIAQQIGWHMLTSHSSEGDKVAAN